jgi:hypothetical protein
MRWKYYIPHLWEAERQVWEDVYLLPANDAYDKPALWLTIDGLGDAAKPEHGSERPEFQADALRKLGDLPYFIDGTDMVVRMDDFSMTELLDWVRVWLRENGLPVTALVEGSVEEFKGKAFHAGLGT